MTDATLPQDLPPVLPIEAIVRTEDEIGGGEEELPVEPDKGVPLQPGLPET